jgi:hypothetical protein
MDDRAGAALAGLAMTDVDAIRFAAGNRLELAAVTLGDPFHPCLPKVHPRAVIVNLRAPGVEVVGNRPIEAQNRGSDREEGR